MKIRIIFFILLSVLFLYGSPEIYAQLKKVAKVEKVKSFSSGTVILNKSILDEVEVYSVTLQNNSKFYGPIVFWLGNKNEMIKNLNDLSKCLEEGEKGDVFEFSACGQDYQLSVSRTLGSKCFKIWETIATSQNYGRFFKVTIDDILEFYSKEDTKIKQDKEENTTE
ncbi:MAG: hypothetical protein IJX44_08490 [Bacteroidaceae bacterium]|nr:hypothetical protein [Bacteroidaceae bacterium]